MMQHQPQKTGFQNTSFISGLLLQIILASVYFAFRFIAEFGRGAKHPALHAVISAILFFAVYHGLCILYKEFQKLNSPFAESAVSHIISLFLSDILLWAEAWQTWPKADAPFATLVLIPLIFQSAVIIMYLAIIVPELYKRTAPEDTLLVLGTCPAGDTRNGLKNSDKPDDPVESFLEQLTKKHGESFHVTEIAPEDIPLQELLAKVERNSSVVLYGVSPDIRASLIRHCTKAGKNVFFMPDQNDLPLLGSSPVWLTDTVLMKREFGDEHLLQQSVKRCMDIVISAGLLILLFPFMLVTACAILLEDGGPVIYTQRRYTLNGKVFEILKFRTMQKNTEDEGVHPYTKNDSRVTKVGRILRRLHLDELPQLINILKGDMSLVGPRPEQVELADLYTEYLKEYPERLRVRAGLTGLAQVYGRYSIEPQDKLRDDLMYIENQSILLDIKILMLTAVSIFRTEGTEGFDAELSEKLHDGADALASRESGQNEGLTREGASSVVNVACNYAECDVGTKMFPAERAHKLAKWFSWIEGCLQWAFYPLLLFWCTYDLLGRIKWIKGIETIRAIRTFLMSVIQPGVWSLLAVVVVVFIGTGLTATDKSELGKRAPARIFCHPFVASLVITLFGVFLIHTFSKTIPMEFLLILILLSGYAQGKRTATFLFGFFAFGTMFGVLSWILHLSEDFIMVFNYGVCHSLGFVNPNSLGLYIFLTFIFWWLLTDEKHRRRVFIVGGVTAALCFLVNGCRTATALILFLVICSCCLMDLEVRIPRKAARLLVTILPVLMLLVSVLTGVTLYQIDKVFHSNFIVRVVDFVYAIEDKGLSLFPQSFNDTERYYYFDTGYYAWIFRRGLLASIGLLLPMMRLNRLVSVRGGRKNIMLLLCAGLYFCMEGVDILLVMSLLAFAGVFIESGSFEG